MITITITDNAYLITMRFCNELSCMKFDLKTGPICLKINEIMKEWGQAGAKLQ